MLKKYCFICGCYFETNNARAKYCSIECKKEGRRRYLEKWKKENPDYMKEWAAAHPDYTKEWTESTPDIIQKRQERGAQGLQRKSSGLQNDDLRE